jgi:hypothetical protein
MHTSVKRNFLQLQGRHDIDMARKLPDAPTSMQANPPLGGWQNPAQSKPHHQQQSQQTTNNTNTADK